MGVSGLGRTLWSLDYSMGLCSLCACSHLSKAHPGQGLPGLRAVSSQLLLGPWRPRWVCVCGAMKTILVKVKHRRPRPCPSPALSVRLWQVLSISGPLTPHLLNSMEGGFPHLRSGPGRPLRCLLQLLAGCGSSAEPHRDLPPCLSYLLVSSLKDPGSGSSPRTPTHPHTVGALSVLGTAGSQQGCWELGISGTMT